MGISGGPQIIRDSSLVLTLEASDQNSNNRYQGRNWFDLSGNNNSGSIINGPSLNNDAYGSFNFNGINSYINLGASSAFNLTNLSLSVWFKTTKTSNQILIGKSYTTSYYLNVAPNATPSNSSFSLWTSFHELNATGITTLGDGNWHNIVATMSGTTKTTYFDGLQVATGTGTIPNTDAYNVIIGNSGNPNVSFPFSGSISTVQIYNRALSAAEVQQNYNQYKTRFNRTTPNIVTYTSLNTTTAIESFNDVLEFSNVLVGSTSFGAANAVALVNETP
jgi:hypothetical protein